VRLVELILTPEIKNYEMPQILQQIKSIHVVHVLEDKHLPSHRFLLTELAMEIDNVTLRLFLHVLLLSVLHLNLLHLLLKFCRTCACFFLILI